MSNHSMSCPYPEGCDCGVADWEAIVAEAHKLRAELEEQRSSTVNLRAVAKALDRDLIDLHAEVCVIKIAHDTLQAKLTAAEAILNTPFPCPRCGRSDLLLRHMVHGPGHSNAHVPCLSRTQVEEDLATKLFEVECELEELRGKQ